MGASQSLDATVAPPARRDSRWPRRLGVGGMAAGAIMAFNALQNLARHLTWSDEQWRALLEPLGAEQAYESLPPLPLLELTAAIEIALGAALMVASWRLFWCDRRGIRASRIWAWTTVAYVLITAAWIVAWLSRNVDSIPGVDSTTTGAVYAGFLAVMAILIAFPVFLLYWLGRDDVRADYLTW